MIFNTDEQRQYFLSLLEVTAKRFNADWHAYCLMGNHYHLMLQTPDGNLQRIMRHINGIYTQYFNRSENTDGALFRGRYKAILVDAQAYWLQLSRYIHRNPLEAGLVDDLTDYPWSSYQAYTKARSAPGWLSTEYILHSFGYKNRRQAYKRFINQGVEEEIAQFYTGKKQAPILGDETFRALILAEKPQHIDLPELKKMRKLPDIEFIIKLTAAYYGEEESELSKSKRGRGVTSPARSVAMYLCQEVAEMALSQIADRFGLASYASAGSVTRNIRLKISTDKKFSKEVNSLLLDLTP